MPSPFSCCPVIHEWLWKKTQIEKTIHRTEIERPFLGAKGFNTNYFNFYCCIILLVTCTSALLRAQVPMCTDSISFAVNILNDCNAQKNGLKFYSLSPNIQSVIKFLPEMRGRSLSKSATIWPSNQHYFRMLFFQGSAPFLNQFFNLFIHFST